MLLFKKIKKHIHDFKNNNTGATAIEYALIAAIIFLGIIGSATAFFGEASKMYSKIASEVTNANKTG